jgi:hypothetical protein
MVFMKGGLHGMQLITVGEAFDGRDLAAVRLNGEERAGAHGDAVHVHGAGATLARITAHMGAREAQMIPQEFGQRPARLNLAGHRFAVYSQ